MKYLPPRFLLRRYEVLDAIEPSGTFLEIGAGDLTLTLDLLEKFDEGTAIELTDDLIEIHQSLPREKRERLTVHSADFFALEIADTFDAVVSCEVMEHIADDRGFLQRVNSVLRPEGQLILGVPSRMKYWTVHDEIVGHLRRYEREGLSDLLTQTGFTDIEIRSYGFPWVNALRLPRLILARRQEAERREWDTATQTTESNHRQIPEALARSPLRFVTQPAVFAPLAKASRPFNRFDLSDGYVAVARKAKSG